jgi:hypothetical protein
MQGIALHTMHSLTSVLRRWSPTAKLHKQMEQLFASKLAALASSV